MTSRRLFIGLMATPTVQEAMASYQLKWQWPPTARLTSPDKLHLTLLFLGNVEEAEEERLRQALAAVEMSPLYLRLVAADVFPGGTAIVRPSANRGLELLQLATATVARQLHLMPDAKPWIPHVTLARDAAGSTVPEEAPSIEWDVLGFSLVCSRPERAHSYEVLDTWPAAPQG